MPAIYGTPGDDVLLGTPEADQIEGLAGNDTLIGGGGQDSLYGGTGNDTYVIAAAGVLIVEYFGQGTDTVQSSVTYTLTGWELENLTLTGSAAINGTGNQLNNIITGNDAANILHGGSGTDYLAGAGGNDTLIAEGNDDQLYGGTGNDTYVVDTAGAFIVEYFGEGNDTVQSSVSFTLSGWEIENLTLTGFAATSGTGNGLNNVITGNTGANVLRGGAGADTLLGGDGIDTLFGDEGDDVLYGEEGADTLRGGDGVDTLIGGAGNDRLFADGGDDALYGGTGNDVYVVSAPGAFIVEYAGEGTDGVESSVSYTLSGWYIETLTLTGTAAINGTGNQLDNVIIGNDAANILHGNMGADYLSGGGGNDRLIAFGADDQLYGGTGNDTYVVDNAGAFIVEQVGEGTDTVESSVSYSLSSWEVENLTLTGLSSINGTGNSLNNIITGNDFANVLNGGAGADTLIGGAGSDIFRFTAASDTAFGQADSIGDFRTGIDRIDLSLIDANRLTAAQDGFLFIGSLAFTGRAGELRLVQAGTQFDLFGDTNGDGTADLHIKITGNGVALSDISGAVASPPANQAPAITSGAAASVAENVPTSTIVYQTAATDPDGDSISYRLSGADAALFSVDASGAVRLLASPNFEARSAYSFTVLAEDNRGGSTAQPVTLSIANINEAPVISSGTTATIAENSPTSTIVYQIVASDPEGSALTYTLSGADAASFSIDQNGAVRFLQSPNFEARSSYSFTVNASDGSLSATRGVTVSVTDVNENTGSTPIINETSAANDTAGAAQALLRSQLQVASNPNLEDASLPSVQINGTISTTGDTDFFSITLQAGELLILDVDGTTSLDSFLRVFGPNGTQIASNDDAVSFDSGSTAHSGVAHNLDSLLRFRAPTSGTYTFSIASFQDDNGQATSSGGYTINVSVGPPANQATIDQENVQSLISGSRWNSASVSYGFTTSASQYASGEGDPEKTLNFEALNPTQQGVTRTAFALINQYTGLLFTESVSTPGSAQIRLAMSDEPETAYAFYPGSGDGGDVWFRNSAPASGGSPRYDNPVPGNYGYLTFIHEIGHALGLKHGHESPALSPDRDSMEFSVMTYRGYIGAPDGGGFTNETWGFAQSYMMYDIAALQQIYGVNWNTNAGDTRYSWSNTSGAFSINSVVQWTPGANRVFQTIWDGGGTDTYDLSNYIGSVLIDLRPGEWTITSSVQLANLGGGNIARGNVANALLFNGDPRSLIENAIGGAGNDTIIANQAANRLTGGSGTDTFIWKSAADAADTTGADRILDFVSGIEKIDLSAIDANSTTAANDAFQFIGTNAFTGVAGQLRYDVDSAGVNIYGDMDGNGVADLHIIVNGTTITSSDFIF